MSYGPEFKSYSATYWTYDFSSRGPAPRRRRRLPPRDRSSSRFSAGTREPRRRNRLLPRGRWEPCPGEGRIFPGCSAPAAQRMRRRPRPAPPRAGPRCGVTAGLTAVCEHPQPSPLASACPRLLSAPPSCYGA